MRNYIIIACLLMILISCEVKSGNSCDWEKINYSEKWDYTIECVYRYKHFNATYVIETTSGKQIFFRPKQYLVTIAEPGDRLIKKQNSQIAHLILKDTGDTLESRIFSKTCDMILGIER